MSRYRGPRFKKIRRLRTLPGLIQKKKYQFQFDPKKESITFSKKKKTIWYSLRRKTEITFSLWFDRTTISSIYAYRWKKQGIHRSSFTHLVNGHIVDIPSYRCKPRDIITTKDNETSFDLIQKSIKSSKKNTLPKHLTISKNNEGRVHQIIDRKEIGLRINEFLVVEYYSRQI
ncbi:hypothetical protein LUZ62_010034 [Rhynchospora pubera]|uniref:Ribosomal protein S4 n=1 Tax=Rhynchospora pubera TaxID=906938 RepID=A0AAV8B0N2_9POAL|nr:hypothetical protein LUZ62_010034 [Rhynchospora pubera]